MVGNGNLGVLLNEGSCLGANHNYLLSPDGAAASDPGSATASNSTSCTAPQSEEETSQHDETRDFLDSIDNILFRSISVAEHSVFYNNSSAMYSFVREEDTNGSENLKFKLGFTDRLNARETLLEIICVLYTRRDKDPEAKLFLGKIRPQALVTEALGKELGSSCFALSFHSGSSHMFCCSHDVGLHW